MVWLQENHRNLCCHQRLQSGRDGVCTVSFNLPAWSVQKAWGSESDREPSVACSDEDSSCSCYSRCGFYVRVFVWANVHIFCHLMWNPLKLIFFSSSMEHTRSSLLSLGRDSRIALSSCLETHRIAGSQLWFNLWGFWLSSQMTG